MSQNGTSILFGLRGVSVQAVVADPVLGRVVHVVTDDETAAGCPACGVVSTSARQHRTTRPRDLAQGEDPLAVRWRKKQFFCKERLCERKAFTEQIPEIPARARVTGRMRRAAGRAVGVGMGGTAVSTVSAQVGLSWPTVHEAFIVHADEVPDAVPEVPDVAEEPLQEPLEETLEVVPAPVLWPVSVLGIDETRRGRPTWTQDPESLRWSRSERFETNFVDLGAGHGGGRGLLGQTAGRTKKGVVDWLAAQPQAWRDGITVVAMDPCAAYTSPGNDRRSVGSAPR